MSSRLNFAVQVSVGASLVGDDRIEIRPGHDNEVPFLQPHVGIEIRGEKPARFIALDASDEHQGLAGFLPLDLVNVQLVGGVGKVNQVLSF